MDPRGSGAEHDKRETLFLGGVGAVPSMRLCAAQIPEVAGFAGQESLCSS